MITLGEIIDALKVLYDNSNELTEQDKLDIIRECIDGLNRIELNPI